MAFNREDLITWNELAPSLQTIFTALQNQITALTQKTLLIRIVEKIVHFEHIFQQHQDSEQPHPNDILHILRQPRTKYKVGDIVYDATLPLNCVLECTHAGTTAADSFIGSGYDGYISDTACEAYTTIETLNNKIKAMHDGFERHKLDPASHVYYSEFLTRQHNASYNIGNQVFNDTTHDVTTILEATTQGTTAPSTNVTIPAAFVASDMQSASDELERLNQDLQSHIESSLPHDKFKFLTRQKSTIYHVGDKVFAPGLPAQYYLECVSVTGGATTSNNDLTITIN